MVRFIIEDEIHCETQGEFDSFADALNELQSRAALPWDAEPNRAPCQSWRTCGREYEIIEYDRTAQRDIRRIPALRISASGVTWLLDREPWQV